MDFIVEAQVPRPAVRVVRALMDELDDVTRFMKSVDDVSSLRRDELEDGGVHIVRRWQGSPTTSPAVLRPFLTRESLAWIDDAIWYPEEFKVRWTVTSNMSRLYTCGGTNYFEPHPDEPEKWTRVRLTGSVQVHGDKFPGVPSFLGRKLAPKLEAFIIQKLEPNFKDLALGLQRYLEEARAAEPDHPTSDYLYKLNESARPSPPQEKRAWEPRRAAQT